MRRCRTNTGADTVAEPAERAGLRTLPGGPGDRGPEPWSPQMLPRAADTERFLGAGSPLRELSHSLQT